MNTYGGFYFICDHGKHRNAKQYDVVCNLFVRGAKQKLHPRSYHVAKTAHYDISLHKQISNRKYNDSHINYIMLIINIITCIYIYIYICICLHNAMNQINIYIYIAIITIIKIMI